MALVGAAVSLYKIIPFYHVGFLLMYPPPPKALFFLKQHLSDMSKLCPRLDKPMTAVKAQLNLWLVMYKKTTELASRYSWSPYSVSVWRWVEWGHMCALSSLASPRSTPLPWACCWCAQSRGVPSSPSAGMGSLQSPGSTKAPCCCCCCCYARRCTVTGNSTMSSTARKARSLQSLINLNLMLLTQKVQFSEPQAGHKCYIHIGI